MNKRKFLFIALISFLQKKLLNKSINSTNNEKSTFRQIYLNPILKRKFFGFLKVVFNLFPEVDFHKLIHKNSLKYNSDKDIYINTQKELKSIEPFFVSFRYQIPALMNQKEEMAKQTYLLIKNYKSVNGYLEIGSSGRYLDYLEERINIEGNRYYADFEEPGYSIQEMIDRGQITIGADFIPMNNYNTNFKKLISINSLELITVYIGFHHCPLNLRFEYINSIREILKTGGILILRDHDCNTEDQKSIVALAHDVFNLGTYQTWKYNKNELRNFYSLDFIIDFVEKIGFKFLKKTVYQKGDPTKNALMMFIKK